jgi:ABC-type uncharacterized transport system permease subunit
MYLAMLCFAFYGLSAAIIVHGLFSQQVTHNRFLLISTMAAIVIHGMIIIHVLFVEADQSMSMLKVASLVAWLINVTMLIASLKLPTSILLPVVYSFSGLIVLLSDLMPGAHVVEVNMPPALLVHITLSLFAYACLGIAVLYAIQLAYINLRLKEKSASLLDTSLPPLMVVEGILFKLLLVGTVLLTLALISGFVFLENMFAQEQAHKTLLSLLAWSLYAGILIGHFRFGWRGKPVITATIIGSILLTLAYFGSRFVREVLIN